MAQEEHVEFIARSNVTIYTGGTGTPHRPGTTVRLPKSHADEFDELHVRHEEAEIAKKAEEDAKAKAAADRPVSQPAQKPVTQVKAVESKTDAPAAQA